MYHLPEEVTTIGRLRSPLQPGIPSEMTYVAWYCAARGVPVPRPADWAFFVALAMFRAAAILAGVYTRALAGNASSSAARSAGAPAVIRVMAATALRLARSAPGTPFAAAGGGRSAAAAVSAAAQPGAAAPSQRAEALAAAGEAPLLSHAQCDNHVVQLRQLYWRARPVRSRTCCMQSGLSSRWRETELCAPHSDWYCRLHEAP